jgi:hypothetical protein
MDADALRLSVEHFGVAAIIASFFPGLIFSFNPVALASQEATFCVERGRTSQSGQKRKFDP